MKMAVMLTGLVLGLGDYEIRGRVETLQTTVLFKSVRIMGRVPGDGRRLAVAQTLVKKHQVTMV